MSEDLTKKLPDDGVSRILSRLDSIDSRFDSQEARLTKLEERVDRRLMETRPIWEQVLSRLEAIENALNSINAELGAIKTELGAVKTELEGTNDRLDNLGLDTRAGLKRVERQTAELAGHFIAVRADQSDLERRMDRLEDKLDQSLLGRCRLGFPCLQLEINKLFLRLCDGD